MRISQSRSWSVSFRRGSFLRRVIAKPPGQVERLVAYSTFARISMPMTSDPLEAVREGSNTGEPPQHQATHHRVDHRLATLAQPHVVLAHPPALREPADGSFRDPAPR